MHISNEKVYPVSILNDLLVISIEGNVYRINDTDAQLLASSPFSIVRTLDHRRYRVWELYLKTFYGDLNVPLYCENGKMMYDIRLASIQYRDGDVYINDCQMKPIPGYYGYFISRDGVVYSSVRDCLIKHRIDEDGYHKVDMYPRDDGSFKSVHSHPSIRLVHHMVYAAWVENVVSKDIVIDHKDTIIWHNYPENLEIVTAQENSYRAMDPRLMGRRDFFQWTRERAEIACALISEGKSSQEVANHFGFSADKDKLEYSHFIYKLIDLRNRCNRGEAKFCEAFLHKYDLQSNALRVPYDAYDRITCVRLVQERCAQNGVRAHQFKRRVLSEDEIKSFTELASIGMSHRVLADRYDIAVHYAEDLSRPIKFPDRYSSTTIERADVS